MKKLIDKKGVRLFACGKDNSLMLVDISIKLYPELNEKVLSNLYNLNYYI